MSSTWALENLGMDVQMSPPPAREPDYYDLDPFKRTVSTGSPEAQIWFNRGLVWCYAFNHEEAATCFEKALSFDRNCAMAYWGVAYALGPNYNKPWTVFDKAELESTIHRARQACEQAKARIEAASPVEQGLINAIQLRFPDEQSGGDCWVWNKSYSDAMGLVYAEFPDDLDVAALYADALMNLTPWKLWDIRTGKPQPGSRTMEAKEIIERGLDQRRPDHRGYTGFGRRIGMIHAGLLHLYIHLMEMSSTPEAALEAANYLIGLIPDAGHLNHMPSHIDVLIGDYQSAINANGLAIRADDKFVKRSGPLNFYTLYRAHNYHFRVYAAMFAGQSKTALDTVKDLEVAIPEEVLRVETPPMADWLEGFLSVRVHVLIRFGLWKNILALQLPQDESLYCVTTAMMHYAKGIAYGAIGNLEDAVKQQSKFLKARQRVPESRTLFTNKCVDILAIARAMLDGELAYRRGDFDAAFAHLRQSIALDDGLPYDEPWGWMQPTRHAYGALLLEQGHIEEAAAVYKADLGIDNTLPRALQHRNNIWALKGYHECLVKLGDTEEARLIDEKLRVAGEHADIPVNASCFCRLDVN